VTQEGVSTGGCACWSLAIACSWEILWERLIDDLLGYTKRGNIPIAPPPTLSGMVLTTVVQ
jgi:hypothetical protein